VIPNIISLLQITIIRFYIFHLHVVNKFHSLVCVSVGGLKLLLTFPQSDHDLPNCRLLEFSNQFYTHKCIRMMNHLQYKGTTIKAVLVGI